MNNLVPRTRKTLNQLPYNFVGIPDRLICEAMLFGRPSTEALCLCDTEASEQCLLALQWAQEWAQEWGLEWAQESAQEWVLEWAQGWAQEWVLELVLEWDQEWALELVLEWNQE
eukprot:TRINITY_DN3678_c0_g1_i2.p2 TRINITY_DN3678_c0_g1~~TRINITY_DN3678_c0_g1_i2.p2  ORF type:complete len:114 (+),score=21.79 TRINITY_DN3678_c0_g1_i2:68-409(+)